MFAKIVAAAVIEHVRDMTFSGRVRRATTFSPEIYATVRTLNELLDRDIADIHFFFEGHVRGFKEVVYEKPLDMALLYVAIRSNDPDLRLRALKRLMEEGRNYNSKEMPLNTPPVLMALMKECVKAKGNILRQCRLVDCYMRALSGKAPAVRRALALLGMAEIPEKTGRIAWDDHVSIDRKRPAQLVLDAYIKGLSGLTIVFDAFEDRDAIHEVVCAGAILDITVHCGLEYVVSYGGRYYHQTVVFEHCRTIGDYDALFADKAWQQFAQALRKNNKTRDQLFVRLIERFNAEVLPVLNSDLVYEQITIPSLDLEDLYTYAQGKPLFQVHLGRYLHAHLTALFLINGKKLPERMDKVYLRKKYFDGIYFKMMDSMRFMLPETAFTALERINAVSQEGQEIRAHVVLNRSIIHGLEAAVDYMTTYHEHISSIEVWNNRVAGPELIRQMLLLNKIRECLNEGQVTKAVRLVEREKLDIRRYQLAKASEHFRKVPLRARIGSNSDGHNHKVPGMGYTDRRKVRRWRRLLRVNAVDMIGLRMGPRDALTGLLGHVSVRSSSDHGVVLSLGKSEKAKLQLRSDVLRTGPFGRMRDYVFDLNMHVKDVIVMTLGTAVSYAVYCGKAAFSYGEAVHAFWFFITYGRNMVVDLVAKNGWNPVNWRMKDFDPHNAAVSMFFSFLSIPVLRIADHYFQSMVLTTDGALLEQSMDQMIAYVSAYHGHIAEHLRTQQHAAVEMAKRFLNYVALAALNGGYIYAHNSLRGFTQDVKRRNLMRSFIAGPIAFGLSYLFGWAGVALSVVLMGKIASELVGGYIEGSVKSRKEYELNYATLKEIVPETQLQGDDEATGRRRMTGLLDIVDILWENPRSRTALKKILERAKDSVHDLNIFLEPYHQREKYEQYIAEQLPIRKAHKVLNIFKRVVFAYGPWMENVVKDLEMKRTRTGKAWYQSLHAMVRRGK